MLYLASQSPRRRELLGRLRLDFRVLEVAVVECRQPHESPVDYVRRVALDKARAGLEAMPVGVVVGADTEVVLDDEVFGKPGDAREAAAMLRRLSGRTHQVLSAVCVVSSDRTAQALSISDVTFATLDDAMIDAYVASGEPDGKAGGYAIQGAAQAFISHLSGSYSGVMGLPLHETARLLVEFGVAGSAHVAMPSARVCDVAGQPA